MEYEEEEIGTNLGLHELGVQIDKTGWHHPVNTMLAIAMNSRSDRKKIEIIIETILACYRNDQDLTQYIPVLRKLIKNDLEYRQTLRKLYQDRFGSGLYTDYGNALKLRQLIIREIMPGWKLDVTTEGSKPENRDSEKCFIFCCEAYEASKDRNGHKTDASKKIEAVFRGHVDYIEWRPYLETWLLRDDVPDDIANIIRMARLRMTDLPDTKKEIEFLLEIEFTSLNDEEKYSLTKHFSRIKTERKLKQFILELNTLAFLRPELREMFREVIIFSYKLVTNDYVKIKAGLRFHNREAERNYLYFTEQIVGDLDVIRKRFFEQNKSLRMTFEFAQI